MGSGFPQEGESHLLHKPILQKREIKLIKTSIIFKLNAYLWSLKFIKFGDLYICIVLWLLSSTKVQFCNKKPYH